MTDRNLITQKRKRKGCSMSSFYVGTESLSMITDVISRYLLVGFDAFGFEFPKEIETLFRGESDERIFNGLAGTNLSALEARYGQKGAAEMYDGKDYEEGHDIWKSGGGVQAWHYQLLKSLHCYLYQCSEGDVYNTPIYKAIEKLSERLTEYIVFHLPEYKEAEWK